MGVIVLGQEAKPQLVHGGLFDRGLPHHAGRQFWENANE